MASSLGVWHDCWGYIAALLFLAVLASLAVALRFWSRRVSGPGVQLDDWLALGALFIHHGLCGTVLAAFLGDGLGFDTSTLEAVDDHAATELQKFNFIGTILYGTGSTSIRLSVVLFYLRVFSTKIVRRGAYTIATVSITWFIIIEVLNLATCVPISFTWDRNIQGGHCITAAAAGITPGALNVAITLAIVVLPIHEVVKRKLSRERRFLLLGVFLIGGIAIVASVARLVAIALYINDYGKTDGGTFALLFATTGFEIYIAIIGACAPTLLAIYKRLRGGQAASDTLIVHRSIYTTRPSKKPPHSRGRPGPNSGASRTALRESDDESQPFKGLHDVEVLVPPKERGGFWTDISARPASRGLPPGAIRVQRAVTWNSEC
ncbi:hypothetical protein F4861DRAFT_139691 [Xylaria intraflava]|nr:hypothetical protein F4861DRAFT_139691 [Xylaria intraflava]